MLSFWCLALGTLVLLSVIFFLPGTKHRAPSTIAYLSIVEQSRQPFFYADWQVPDTLDGRFDVIVLHLFLALSAGEEDKEFCRAVQELFFADMDRSLREMGVGDTGVGKRIKAMAQAFYGRMTAYGQAINDEMALEQALRRNVWREQPVTGGAVAALAAYMRRNYAALRGRPSAVVQGVVAFLR